MTSTRSFPAQGSFTAEQASAWVAASLAEAAALRRHDDRLFPRDAASVPTSASIHEGWDRWVGEAQSLMRQLRESEVKAADVERFEEFRYAIDRTRAMLQIAPSNYLRNLEQARRGEGIEVADLREHVLRRREACGEALR